MPATIAYPTVDGRVLRLERTPEDDWTLSHDAGRGSDVLCRCVTYGQAYRRLMWMVEVDLEFKRSLRFL